MARTRHRFDLQPSRKDERPKRVLKPGPVWHADLEHVEANQLDDNEVILLPPRYDEENDVRWLEDWSTRHLWKATVIYEELQRRGEHHPHITPFVRRDEWNAFPVLVKPSGPPLNEFLQQQKAILYSTQIEAVSSRVNLKFLPLMYQWALHLISALVFVHAQEISWGEVNLRDCWLSADSHLSLSLSGFVTAGFGQYRGDWTLYEQEFHPSEYTELPTMETDIVLWGCAVYELMTGHWPEGHLPVRSRQQCPPLEKEFMGEIVQKCWLREITNASDLKTEVIKFLQNFGWVVDGEDNLQGIDFSHLLQQDALRSSEEHRAHTVSFNRG